MRCPSCDHDNPEDATICGECGGSIAGQVTQADPPAGTPVRLLMSLTDVDRARVLERLAGRRIAPGEAVIRQGDPPKGLYIVKSGPFAVTVGDRHGLPLKDLAVPLAIVAVDLVRRQVEAAMGELRTLFHWVE